jgi:hypothetical protein
MFLFSEEILKYVIEWFNLKYAQIVIMEILVNRIRDDFCEKEDERERK